MPEHTVFASFPLLLFLPPPPPISHSIPHGAHDLLNNHCCDIHICSLIDMKYIYMYVCVYYKYIFKVNCLQKCFLLAFPNILSVVYLSSLPLIIKLSSFSLVELPSCFPPHAPSQHLCPAVSLSRAPFSSPVAPFVSLHFFGYPRICSHMQRFKSRTHKDERTCRLVFLDYFLDYFNQYSSF